jgi:dolichol-phosphate mannosyltransferase
MTEGPELSVLVPMLNEEGNVRLLAERVAASLAGVVESFEILFIDDGSTDGSVEEVRRLASGRAEVRLVALARNFGKEAAMLAGYDHARGRAVVVVDADLQQPPELFASLVGLWRQGFEVVDAVRTETRGIGPWRRRASWAFYALNRRLLGIAMSPDTADFRLMDRAVVDVVRACRERHRFNRALVAWSGFRRASVPYSAAPRHSGVTKWSGLRLAKYAMDGVLSFSVRPLRAVGLLGGVLSSLSFLYLVFVAVLRVVRPELAGADFGYASIIGMIALLGGSQLLCAWLLGEYVGRIYEQVKGRPPYVVRAVVDGSGGLTPPGAAGASRQDAAHAMPGPHAGASAGAATREAERRAE